MARQKTKTELLSVRVSPKIRYGLELIARKQRRNLSDTVNLAIEYYLEVEGSTIRNDTEIDSLLDKIWSENEIDRSLNVACLAPRLATNEDLKIAEMHRDLLKLWGDNIGYDLSIKINTPEVKIFRYMLSEHGTNMLKHCLSGAITIDEVFKDLVEKTKTDNPS